MIEVDAVASQLPIERPASIDQRIRVRGKIGEQKTSMLQRLEVACPTELDSSPHVPLPHTRSIAKFDIVPLGGKK